MDVLLNVVVICDNEKWIETFSGLITESGNLSLKRVISSYKDLDEAIDQYNPEILVVDLDLLKSTGVSYEFLFDRITSWEPKLPFVMAIDDEDHREINTGKMRFGIDFWNNKTPEEGSARDVFRILDDIAHLISEAKERLPKKQTE